jgi:hypothetical protein
VSHKPSRNAGAVTVDSRFNRRNAHPILSRESVA